MVCYEEPLRIIDKLSPEGKSDMSNWQTSYLCGLIKEKCPKKILEIGVSAGGTTAIILNCLSLIDVKAEVYSLDISDKYRINPMYKIGFMVEEAKKIIPNCSHHEMLVGIAPDLIDNIGDEIDFLILDTVHLVPGEILDFLICLPYLKDGATVVLHDVILHKYGNGSEIATQLLLDVVTADKYPIFGFDNDLGYPNIAAFKINSDTKKYIYDVFSALLIPWQYYIPEDVIQDYRDKFIELGYEENCIKVFDIASRKTNETIDEKLDNRAKGISNLFEELTKYKEKNIYIYGTGNYGRRLASILGETMVGFIVSDNYPRDNDAIYISEYEFSQKDIIIIAVKRGKAEVIREKLEKKGIKNTVILSEVFYKVLMEV